MVVLVSGFSTGKIDIGKLELRRSFMPGVTPYIKVYFNLEPDRDISIFAEIMEM